MSILLILVVAALILTIVAAIGKCPIWVPVLLLCIVVALQVLPLK